MIARSRQKCKTLGMLACVLAAVVSCTGCAAPPKQGGNYPDPGRRGQPLSPPELIDPTTIPTRDDIVAIHQFWPSVPWLWEGDRVVGFRAPVYFVSGQTEKGAFVSGTIFVWVYRLERGPDARPTRNLAHMWEFDESAALSYRVRKEGVAGYFYGFMLNWPPNVDLDGHLIEIEFGYERGDKTVVTGAPRRFRVPISADYVPATKKETP